MIDKKAWNKIIAHVDMDSFFASIEQRDDESLRNQPIGIINGSSGTTIITSSYEARDFGIKTGMHVKEALRRCPSFQAIASRPHHYAAVSTLIMQALDSITPDIEVFSIDEAFLDITHCKALHKSPKELASKIHNAVDKAVGLTCSVGISGDKTTAKYAGKKRKPNGTCIIPPWQSEDALKNEPVTVLCGVNHGIEAFFHKHGVSRCGEVKRLPLSTLSSRYGNVGKRIWYMAQGNDPEPIQTAQKEAKTMSCSKVIPPNTTDGAVLEGFLYALCDKLSFRLRTANLCVKKLSAALKLQYYCIEQSVTFPVPSQDDKVIFNVAKALLSSWKGEGVFQIIIRATEVVSNSHVQTDLFSADNEKRRAVLKLRDKINARFGHSSLQTATGLMSPKMTEVISPSWRPTGTRHSVQTSDERAATVHKKKKPIITDVQSALSIAEGKWHKIKEKSIFKRRGKLAAFLIRKNVKPDIAWKVATTFDAEGISEDCLIDDPS